MFPQSNTPPKTIASRHSSPSNMILAFQQYGFFDSICTMSLLFSCRGDVNSYHVTGVFILRRNLSTSFFLFIRRNMPRKKSTSRPRGPAKKKRKTPDDVTTLACPNHMCSPVLADNLSDEEARGIFPLVTLMLPETSGSGTPHKLAFVDEIYECTIPGDREIYAPPYAPPTWMDPEVFVRLIKDDERIKAIAAEAIKKRSQAPAKRMVPVIQELFEERYIGYLLDRFDEVKELLAQWLVTHHADQAEGEKLTKSDRPNKKRTRKRKGT